MESDSIRPGEASIELPASFDAGLYYIGRIRTPWRRREDCPKNAGEAHAAGAICTIEVAPRYAAALTEIDTCPRLLVLYWMHEARRDLVVQSPRHHGRPRGTFALRSPVRPNPVAASVVELVRAEGNRLTVIGLDCLDGTPLIDLKPHYASADGGSDTPVASRGQQKVDV
jgi:tRNA-Thr(GGU) m(6)t(6)A37 methyltransferase TsaA